MPEFSHLHVHTQYSLLDGAASIKSLVKKAHDDGMKAVAITDHGNMFGAFQFVAEAVAQGIKPIVGCEFYMVQDRHIRSFTKEDADKRYHQLLLAKNEEGYRNLTKLCSLGFIEGLYGKFPRIDKELIEKYHKGLIATSCCIGAEIPQALLHKGKEHAESLLKWWIDLFGEDYYIELQRHDIPNLDGTGISQEDINQQLLELASKYNLKVIATNDSHYLDVEDYKAHDILLCINTGNKVSTPKGYGAGKRFAFHNDQFFFKTQAEMNERFADVPQAIDNTMEIVDKIELLQLKQPINLPNFEIPKDFVSQDTYLEWLTYQGARLKYGDPVPAEVKERIDFEISTINTMGFAGYFLIVADFINKGKEMGVLVGPGRGSAAGSAVAYCLGITNIDPIRYNLLFERFLNPDRKSMPDIDTDFDDGGRDKVIQYVVEKYGKEQVAQIITFGTLAARSSIADVARAYEFTPAEIRELSALVPDRPGISLSRVMLAELSGAGSLADKEGLDSQTIDRIRTLRDRYTNDARLREVLDGALKLEGSIKSTGVHAAGVIIAPRPLTDIIPIAVAKDSSLYVTQYEGKIIEDAGVIKMDFLGLRNLSIIKDALVLIKENHGLDLDLDNIPLDDEKTYSLYQAGRTNATFQFESVGMQKHLKDLKPDKFDDLIAMNALFRPGPMAYIPQFIKRKHGEEAITYDLPDMEEYLSDTYGITVYQEQVMLLSQKLGGFTKGDADTLRKAMGKKQKEVLDKMKSKFMEGGEAKGHPKETLNKIWTDWEAFAQYAFNKSHSTCYAFVAYQTAYLKANYSGEYMAAVLSNSMGNMDKVTFLLTECARMGLKVLGPSVNYSSFKFNVTGEKNIRFGMAAIKGAGEAAVESIVVERKANGPFTDIFDFMSRVDLRTVNKKTIESLALAGAFDDFGFSRGVYLLPSNIDKLVKYGQKSNADLSGASSLFGGEDAEVSKPKLDENPAANPIEILKKEKETIGLYVSGHPLDRFTTEIESFCYSTIEKVKEATPGTKFQFAAIVHSVKVQRKENNDEYGFAKVEDKSGELELQLFKPAMFAKFKPFLTEGTAVYISGEVKTQYNSDRLYTEYSNIRFLSELTESAKALQIRLISMAGSYARVAQDIFEILSQHQGSKEIKFKIREPKTMRTIDLASDAIKVNIQSELLQQLSLVEGVSLRLLN